MPLSQSKKNKEYTMCMNHFILSGLNRGFTMKQFFKDIVHNCIIHPMLPFIPRKLGAKLHDKNAKWAYGNIS